MLSTFTTTVRSDMDINLDPAGSRKAKAEFDRDHATLTTALAQYEKERLPERLAAWLKRPERNVPKAGWLLLDIAEAKSAGGATLTPQSDGSLLANGKNPIPTSTPSRQLPTATDHRIRLEALAHPSFVKGGPGRAGTATSR